MATSAARKRPGVAPAHRDGRAADPHRPRSGTSPPKARVTCPSRPVASSRRCRPGRPAARWARARCRPTPTSAQATSAARCRAVPLHPDRAGANRRPESGVRRPERRGAARRRQGGLSTRARGADRLAEAEPPAAHARSAHGRRRHLHVARHGHEGDAALRERRPRGARCSTAGGSAMGRGSRRPFEAAADSRTPSGSIRSNIGRRAAGRLQAGLVLLRRNAAGRGHADDARRRQPRRTRSSTAVDRGEAGGGVEVVVAPHRAAAGHRQRVGDGAELADELHRGGAAAHHEHALARSARRPVAGAS